MKENKFIKRILIALTFALAVTVIAPTTDLAEVQAATKKVTGAANWKKAPSVKIKKTYKVTSKNQKGTYVKFKAPKAGKYVVTIYNVNSIGAKASDYDSHLANFYIRKPYNSDYLTLAKVKTQGGKSDVLFMATPDSYNAHYKGVKVTTKTYLQKRTATLTLKKGETIYVNMNYYTGKKCRCTYNLKINRK